MQENDSPMFVIKRNGTNERVQFDKITKRISGQIKKDEKDFLDPGYISQKVITSIYSGITTEELDIESANICMNMATTHPLYGNLAGRILVSNLHKKTEGTFVEKMNLIHENTSRDNKNLLDANWLDWINKNKEQVDSIIDYSRDYNLDFFAFKTLERAYLLKHPKTNQIYERPQDMFLRVASFINQGDLARIKITYDLMSTKAYTHATPTLFNAGSTRPQLSSCFLLGTDDSLEGITQTWDSVARISKWAGGIGLHVSNIRGKDSIIRGTNGISSGIIPMLQVYNNIARYINQAGKRKGSFAIYLEPHHPDIFEFLELRKNFGAETERARDLFLALWISDLFMEQVEKDSDWYLFCPDEAPGLTAVYGEEYNKLYWRYVDEKKYKKKVSARKLMEKIFDAQLETGTPYMLYKDSINRKSNQKNIGTIKSSNLCVSGDTYIITDEGVFDIKNLVNKNVNIWNGFEFSNVDIRKTGENKSLNKVVFSNGEHLYCTPEHKFYIKTKYGNSKESIIEIRCKELKENMKIIKYDFPIIDNKKELRYNYTQGFFSADGTYECEQDVIKQCNYKKNSGKNFCKRHLFFTGTEKYNDYITNENNCNGITGIKRPKLYLYDNKKDLINYIDCREDCSIREIKNRIEVALPLNIEVKYYVPINYSINSKLRWFEGYCDGDGCITTNKKSNTQSLQLTSINDNFLMDVKKMLHTMSINCKVSNVLDNRKVLLPDGKGGKKEYKCKKLYRLIISSVNLNKLVDIGFKPNRLILNNHKPSREASEFVKVISNQENSIIDDTYCFTEPKRNYGVFNGILTGQCAEIVEYSDDKEHAVCNLASIAINHSLIPFKCRALWTIYTKEDCVYCDWTKKYMQFNNYKYIEIPYDEEVGNDLNKYREKLCEDGVCTIGNLQFPQIFYGKKHIGGFNEMIKFAANRYNFDDLWNTAYEATLNLDKVIDINYYPTDEAKLSNTRHRPIGLGIQGLADTLVKMKILFDSDEAVSFSEQMMETIYHAALTASKDIAKNLTNPEIKYSGAYSTFEGSPLHQGKFQFELWNVEPKYKQWDELREEISKYGVRNSLVTALMPTASTSQILGNNECFEWFTNNIYTRRTLAGDFPLVNKHLVDDLLSIGEWNNNIKQIIIADDGSVKSIPHIPSIFKNQYKTIWEIKQIWVLKHAKARAPFVDQTQSMNIFMAVPDYKKLNSCHMWGWKNGLKTGMYYLRTKAAKGAIKFTVDPKLQKQIEENNEICESCSA